MKKEVLRLFREAPTHVRDVFQAELVAGEHRAHGARRQVAVGRHGARPGGLGEAVAFEDLNERLPKAPKGGV